jgi:hypothetical protein
VAVAINDFFIFNGDIATVKFNNVVMHAAPNCLRQALTKSPSVLAGRSMWRPEAQCRCLVSSLARRWRRLRTSNQLAWEPMDVQWRVNALRSRAAEPS